MANVVLVIDRSGSMSHLPFDQARQAALAVAQSLRPSDRVAVVSFGNDTRVDLPSSRAGDKASLTAVLESMRSGGSTPGADGLVAGLRQAERGFVAGGGINRVVLLTDGGFNRGVTAPRALVDLARAQKRRGIYLSVLGFGGGAADFRLESLADQVDGVYEHALSWADARRLGAKIAAQEVVARDVKIQVRFDPVQVASWKLVGYENRGLANRDFRRDEVDGGELATGHHVTALYELIPNRGLASSAVKVTVRYQHPHREGAREAWATLSGEQLSDGRGSPDLRFAAGVVAFARVLTRERRGMANALMWDVGELDDALTWISRGVSTRPTPARRAFLELAHSARAAMPH